MSALDGVLADLVEADRECAYVTVKREPLEDLIHDWAKRGDRLDLLCTLLPRARQELAQTQGKRGDATFAQFPESALSALDNAIEQSACALAQHRHAIRRELVSRVKQVLHSAIADVGKHVTDALLAGNTELADRLESERQTVRLVMSTIDGVVDRLLHDELSAAAKHQNGGQCAA